MKTLIIQFEIKDVDIETMEEMDELVQEISNAVKEVTGYDEFGVLAQVAMEASNQEEEVEDGNED